MHLRLGILALLLTPPGLPSGGFHWQRTITPPPAAPTAQACVVLDAATFANAAPALRDLRLFQDGTELPFVVEESYDSRALDSGVTPVDDRSFYEPSLVATLRPRLAGAVPGDLISRDTRTHQLLRHGETDSWLGTYDATELPAHVPVERLRLDPAPATPAQIMVIAKETATTRNPPPTETVNGTVDVQHPALPLTLGANLQHPARLSVFAEHSDQVFRRAIFEMRRRSLCYQPRSASPLTLYLGGGPGMSAKTYSYASDFSTAVDRPYATLGPLVPNPDGTADAAKPANPQRKGILWAATLAAAFFVFTANRLLRKAKRL